VPFLTLEQTFKQRLFILKYYNDFKILPAINNEKIIVTGATGLIGRKLCSKLSDQWNEIEIFTRNPEKVKKVIGEAKEYVNWNYNNPEEWKNYLNETDTVVHLAGVNLGAKIWDKALQKAGLIGRKLSPKLF
jgi:NAD dependent epimerase/dehydratase family enzyme